MKTKNSSDKMLPILSMEPGSLITYDSHNHSPFWTNLIFSSKTYTLGSLCSHALLILTESSKSKNHEQTPKDPLNSTCQVSPEKIVSDLESEV